MTQPPTSLVTVTTTILDQLADRLVEIRRSASVGDRVDERLKLLIRDLRMLAAPHLTPPVE
jgi:hypothetical protein